MCNKLEKAQDRFKLKVKTKIDQFEDIIYTSSYIPIVIRLQQIYRMYYLMKQKRLEKRHAFRLKTKKCILPKQFAQVFPSDDESDMNMMNFNETIQRQMTNNGVMLD